MQAEKTTPHIHYGKGATTLVLGASQHYISEQRSVKFKYFVPEAV
jgi:hypothetical protein